MTIGAVRRRTENGPLWCCCPQTKTAAKARREWRCAMTVFSGAASSRKWQKSDTISEETLYFPAEFIFAAADDVT
jgi:hypothetical protein